MRPLSIFKVALNLVELATAKYLHCLLVIFVLQNVSERQFYKFVMISRSYDVN